MMNHSYINPILLTNFGNFYHPQKPALKYNFIRSKNALENYPHYHFKIKFRTVDAKHNAP